MRCPALRVLVVDDEALMTAFGTPDVVEGALQLGAYRVVANPFGMDEVAALVSQACASRA